MSFQLRFPKNLTRALSPSPRTSEEDKILQGKESPKATPIYRQKWHEDCNRPKHATESEEPEATRSDTRMQRQVDLSLPKKRDLYTQSNWLQVIDTGAEEPRIAASTPHPESRTAAHMQRFQAQHAARDIEVHGVGEAKAVPDVFRAVAVIRSAKPEPQDAKNSVQRRMDYVIQTLRAHGAKASDVSADKLLLRDGRQYVMQAEVSAEFGDAAQCQQAVSLLAEKLDDSVTMAPPTASLSPARLDQARRNAVLAATRAARVKAQELASFLHVAVGRALSLKETAVEETPNYDPDVTTGILGTPSLLLHQVHSKTVVVRAAVNAVFLLRQHKKKE